jgi:glycosyltransferase involved in cell wall biosynthesis
MNVSVIVPVYNEEQFIGKFLDQLQSQDFPGEWETILADGHSTDKSREIILERSKSDPRIVLIDNPNKFVPHALNAALKVAKGAIIVRMDAHSSYPQHYIRRLTEELERLQADNVGGVWNTLPGDETIEAQSIALATAHPLGIGNAHYRLGASGIHPVDTVPYGCFPRELFQRIGTFDTDLLRNQDDEFNGRILRNGGKIYLVSDVVIDYHARKSFEKMRAMFYQYGLFKPLVNIKLGAPATWRQFAPPALALLLSFAPWFVLLPSPWSYLPWLPILLYAVAIYFVSRKLAFKQPNHWMLQLSAVALGATVYAMLPVHVGAPIRWGAAFLCMALPDGLRLMRATARERMLFFKLLITFPQIHLSYGFGYIFGWIRFGLFRAHRRKTVASISDNR